jgi:hypothetical protein
MEWHKSEEKRSEERGARGEKNLGGQELGVDCDRQISDLMQPQVDETEYQERGDGGEDHADNVSHRASLAASADRAQGD